MPNDSKSTSTLDEFLQKKLSSSNVNEAIDSLCYQCRMLWLGRTDKLYTPDTPALIELSVFMTDITTIDPDSIGHVQKFSIPHATLASQLKDSLINYWEDKVKPPAPATRFQKIKSKLGIS